MPPSTSLKLAYAAGLIPLLAGTLTLALFNFTLAKFLVPVGMGVIVVGLLLFIAGLFFTGMYIKGNFKNPHAPAGWIKKVSLALAILSGNFPIAPQAHRKTYFSPSSEGSLSLNFKIGEDQKGITISGYMAGGLDNSVITIHPDLSISHQQPNQGTHTKDMANRETSQGPTGLSPDRRN